MAPKPLPRLRLAMDLGSALLLQAGDGRWCLATAHSAGARWHGLQLALRLGPGLARREPVR